MASVDFTRSALDLAKRDLRKTVLNAPFDGSIGVREVEPFVDVRRGQKLFEVDAKGEQEILVNIPETVVNFLNVDMQVDVDFPTLPDTAAQGRITEVSTLASEGSAFPVQVRLIDPPSSIRSGMTAEASFRLQDSDFAGGYPIPGAAIKPTAEANRGFVFVYQAATSTVKQSPIEWRGVKDNMVVISNGVSPDDILAVAGVSFLTDGMKVKLMAKVKQTKPKSLEIE